MGGGGCFFVVDSLFFLTVVVAVALLCVFVFPPFASKKFRMFHWNSRRVKENGAHKNLGCIGIWDTKVSARHGMGWFLIRFQSIPL